MMIVSNIIRLLLITAALIFSVYLMLTDYGILGLILHLVVVTPLLWGTLHPSSRLFGPIQTSTTQDGLWLTIDDGPDPTDTPILLELLEKHQVIATFFVIGQKAAAYPELIRQIHDAGHQIGNHTWSHPQASFWSKGPWATFREIARCQKCIKSITGKAPTVFRAPVGHSNIFVHSVLKYFRLQLIGWSSRGFDAVSTDLDKVNHMIGSSMQPGAIILVHESTSFSTQVVQSVLKNAQNRKLTFTIPSS